MNDTAIDLTEQIVARNYCNHENEDAMTTGKDDAQKIGHAAIELTTALAKTMRDLSPLLQKKFGLDAPMLAIAISQATSRTAAMSAMAAAGGSLEDAQHLSSQLDEVFNKTFRAKS